MNRTNRSGRIIYNPRSKSFRCPTPKDPDYEIGLEQFSVPVPSLLCEVCHWRSKGIPDTQIIDLLEAVAGVID